MMRYALSDMRMSFLKNSPPLLAQKGTCKPSQGTDISAPSCTSKGKPFLWRKIIIIIINPMVKTTFMNRIIGSETQN